MGISTNTYTHLEAKEADDDEADEEEDAEGDADVVADDVAMVEEGVEVVPDEGVAEGAAEDEDSKEEEGDGEVDDADIIDVEVTSAVEDDCLTLGEGGAGEVCAVDEGACEVGVTSD